MALAAAGAAHASVSLTTGVQVSNPSLYNGFEGIGDWAGNPDFTGPYSEGGITVQYVNDDGIWTTSQAEEGTHSWYNDGGGNGYTDITRTDGGDFKEISFATGSGYFGGGASLLYEVLNNGVTVATGLAGPVPGYQSGWTFYGFTGGGFDEVRLKVSFDGAFSPTAFEGGAYDAIAANGGVPEPATWAMMIVGFGLAGAMVRRRKLAVA